MVGSEIEHAMLLCNFFTTIGKKAFLVLGQGVPEGDTAYVLTVEESGEQDRLWNPMTAESFSISETFCPLGAISSHVFTNLDNATQGVATHLTPMLNPGPVSYRNGKFNVAGMS